MVAGHHSSWPIICRESTWGPPALWFGSKTGQGWQRLGGVIGCEGQRGLGHKAAPEQSEGNNCWHLYRQHIRDSLELCLQPTWVESPHGPPLLQHYSLWGKGHSTGRGESTHLKETEPARAWPSGLLLQQLGIRLHPDRVVMATAKRGSPTSHLDPATAPPSSAPSPTKVIAASTPWRKTWLMSTSNPALPPKALGTCSLHRDAPT